MTDISRISVTSTAETALKKNRITVTGENLTLGKYFEEDLLIKGKITGVQID